MLGPCPKRVLRSVLRQKKNPQGPQTSVFIQTSPNSTHSWPVPITARKLKREQRKSLVRIADHTELELTTCLKLVKFTPQEEIIVDLISTVHDTIEGCRIAALYKIKAVEKDEITSVRLATSRKTSRMISAPVYLIALEKKI